MPNPEGPLDGRYDGSLSAQWEHTVLVTSDGCEILTDRGDRTGGCRGAAELVERHQKVGQRIGRHDDQTRPQVGLNEDLSGHEVGGHDPDRIEIGPKRPQNSLRMHKRCR